jgi:hypothetical protein
MDKVSGCGENVHTIARKEFFSILNSAIIVLHKTESDVEIMHVIDAFYWSYRSADLLELSKINIFKVLSEGDGSKINPLRLAWGHLLKQTKDHKDDTLTRKVIRVFNFLFKIVLRCVVMEDSNFTSSEYSTHASIVNSKKISQAGLVNSAEKVMQQIFEVLFGNVERYLDILSRFDPGWQSLIEDDQIESLNLPQDPKDLLIDDLEFVQRSSGKLETAKAVLKMNEV